MGNATKSAPNSIGFSTLHGTKEKAWATPTIETVASNHDLILRNDFFLATGINTSAHISAQEPGDLKDQRVGFPLVVFLNRLVYKDGHCGHHGAHHGGFAVFRQANA